MNQLIAMGIRPPNFDYAKVAERAQGYQMGQERLKNAQMDNQLAGMKLEAATDQLGAEKEFRKRSAAGDPNADEALAGYPEMQKKLWDAFDGMSPKNYKAAQKKAARFGEAARNVLLFKDGTPEQIETWNDEITKLAEDGTIPQEQADQLIEAGPNPLIIEQALSVENWTKLHQKRSEFAQKEQRLRDKDVMADDTKRAIAADKEEGALAREKLKEEGRDRREALKEGGRNERAATDDERLDAKAKKDIERIESQIEKNRRTGGGKGSNEDAVVRDEIKGVLKDARKSLEDLEPGTPEFNDAVAKYEQHRTRVFKHFGYAPDGRRLSGGAGKATADAGGDGKSASSPASPKSKAEFDALPSGAYFLNPADGKLKRKN